MNIVLPLSARIRSVFTPSESPNLYFFQSLLLHGNNIFVLFLLYSFLLIWFFGWRKKKWKNKVGWTCDRSSQISTYNSVDVRALAMCWCACKAEILSKSMFLIPFFTFWLMCPFIYVNKFLLQKGHVSSSIN